MPSIIQICVEGNTGSTGRIAEEIGILAMEKGWNSYIAYGRFPRPSKSKLIKIGGKTGIYFHVFLTRLFDMHCLGSFFATRKLLKRIKEINPDIIHLHHLHGYYINIKLLFNYLKNTSIPVVWTFHDCWSFTGHCAYFDFVQCEKWKTLCYDCPQKSEYPASILFDRSTKNYLLKKELFTSVTNMTVVPVSNWLGKLVKESFLKNMHVKVIYNGVDTDLFKPQHNGVPVREKYNIGDKFMIIGVASTWERRKGLMDFIRLSSILNDDEVIVLIGLNKNQLKSLPENIIGLTRTDSRQELIDLYSASDLFINPTWEDNFPSTNIEALSCGTPVVTYKTGGSIEAVTIETGFIAEKGDIDAVAGFIKTVKNRTKGFYSDACIKRSNDYYSKKDRFNEYFQLYDQLLNYSNK